MPLITDRAVERLAFAEHGQYSRASGKPGLFLVVGRDRKSWTFQTELTVLGARRQHKEVLGHHPDMSVADAVRAAELKRAELRAGKAAPGKAPAGITLRQAWALYREQRLVDASPRTVEQYEDVLERTLHDWLDRPLKELAENPVEVANRHKRIKNRQEPLTEKDKVKRALRGRATDGGGGPYHANHCMRVLRAVYLFARQAHSYLPDQHPCRMVKWHKEKPRADAPLMDARAIRGWFAQWATIKSPIRREMHLLFLLSAARRTALLSAEWRHLDLRRRVLHQPRPKGGEDKAYDIPLSRAMVASLRRLREVHRADQWESPFLFPSDRSESGHITRLMEDELPGFKYGHDLRHTWCTHAAYVGLSEFHARAISNHQTRRDVHSRYVDVRALNRPLRRSQEQMSRYFLRLAPPEALVLMQMPRRAAEEGGAVELGRAA